jgi:hypothetical protein
MGTRRLPPGITVSSPGMLDKSHGGCRRSILEGGGITRRRRNWGEADGRGFAEKELPRIWAGLFGA